MFTSFRLSSFLAIICLTLLLTACPLASGTLWLYVSVDEANLNVCDAGMQAMFTVGRRTIETPRLQAGQDWQRRVGEFSVNDVIPVNVEAYCYRNGQEAGYIRADLQVRVDIAQGSVSIAGTSKDWCDTTKFGWIEAIEPVPCLNASYLEMPTPLIFVVDAEEAEANVCDAGLQTTVSVQGDSLTNPRLTSGERWVGSVGRLDRVDFYPYIVEAYCYSTGQETGYTKVSSTLLRSPRGAVTIYTLDPSTTHQQCISTTEAVDVETFDPSPCISFVAPKP